MSHRSSRLGRRAFISATGATVIGLPLLEAFEPKLARAASGIPRFIGFYVANGKHMPAWKPTTDGADYALTPTLMPLSALKKKFSVITGLENTGAERHVGGDHARGTGSFLTCTNIHTSAEVSSGSPPNGISVDQVMADQIGKSSRIASLQLGLTNNGRDTGYGSEFIQNISFDKNGKTKTKTIVASSAFDTLFQGFDPTASAADVERRNKLKASVLDFAVEQAKALSPTISRSDNIKLDQYMTSVRELEQRLQSSGSGAAACAGATKPNNPTAVPDQVKAMMDVMVLALQCDITRVITYMLGNGGDGAINGFPWLSISDHHHAIAHHQNQQVNFDKLMKVNLWEVEELAYLLGKLDAIEEGGATLLDNTMVLYSSEISDGNRHNHDDLPVLLAGGDNLGIKTGQHLRFTSKTPIASLFLSLIQVMGATSVTKFGDDGTAPLPGIMK